MPRIATLGAYKIIMYVVDHNPPHVHVRGPGGINGKIDIVELTVIGDRQVARAKELRDWVAERRDDLLELWERRSSGIVTGELDGEEARP